MTAPIQVLEVGPEVVDLTMQRNEVQTNTAGPGTNARHSVESPVVCQTGPEFRRRFFLLYVRRAHL